MQRNHSLVSISLLAIVLCASCTALEKASLHGFQSGHYTLDTGSETRAVYVDVNDSCLNVYQKTADQIDTSHYRSIPWTDPDSLNMPPVKFRKQSLDIDITSVLLKYRLSPDDLPHQVTTDLNMAVYAGWRHDSFSLKKRYDPLNKPYMEFTQFGFDFGLFAGPGTATINAFSTRNRTEHEYNAMIIQTGLAGFLETKMASFGLAVGFDYLMNRDRSIWIYEGKPWIGFVVGVALN